MRSRPLTRKGESRIFSRLSMVSLALILVLAAIPAWSQSTATGTVSGQVIDASSAAIAGASVKLTDTTTNISLTTMSNDAGRYTFLNVAPGTYNISFTKAGFSVYEANGQKVNVGQVLTINGPLSV